MKVLGDDFVWLMRIGERVDKVALYGEDCLKITRTDPKTVALIHAEVQADGKLSCTIPKIYDKLKGVEGGVTLYTEQDELIIEWASGRMGVMLLPPVKPRKIPDLNYPAEYYVTRAELARGIQAAAKFSNYATFVASEDCLTIKSEGNGVKTTVTIGEPDRVDSTAASTFKLVSREHIGLKRIMELFSGFHLIKVKVGMNSPLWLESDENDRKLIVLLAPIAGGGE